MEDENYLWLVKCVENADPLLEKMVFTFFNSLGKKFPKAMRDPMSEDLEEMSKLDLFDCAYEKALEILKEEDHEAYERSHPNTISYFETEIKTPQHKCN